MARLVSVSVIAAILAVALSSSEIWPLSSFKLFSSVRTGERTSYEVLGVGPDGEAVPVSLTEIRARHPEAADPVGHLTDLSVPDRAATLRLWLETTGYDGAGARVDRVTRRFDLSGDGTTHVVARVTVVEVEF